jgi:hypothetical protein
VPALSPSRRERFSYTLEVIFGGQLRCPYCGRAFEAKGGAAERSNFGPKDLWLRLMANLSRTLPEVTRLSICGACDAARPVASR